MVLYEINMNIIKECKKGGLFKDELTLEKCNSFYSF